MGAAQLQNTCQDRDKDVDDTESIVSDDGTEASRELPVAVGAVPLLSGRPSDDEDASGSDEDAGTHRAVAPRRLLLTSGGLTNASLVKAFAELLHARKPSGGCKVVYIPDAALAVGGDGTLGFKRFESIIRPLGIHELVYLELRTTEKETLREHLETADCIYVELGNTFYLRYQMHASGFDALVRPLVLEKGVVFVGASAGTIVAGRTVCTALWKGWDDPGHGGPWDLSTSYGYGGLDLLWGESVFPHFAPTWTKLVTERRADLDHHVILLDDNHAFLSDGKVKAIIP